MIAFTVVIGGEGAAVMLVGFRYLFVSVSIVRKKKLEELKEKKRGEMR